MVNERRKVGVAWLGRSVATSRDKRKGMISVPLQVRERESSGPVTQKGLRGVGNPQASSWAFSGRWDLTEIDALSTPETGCFRRAVCGVPCASVRAGLLAVAARRGRGCGGGLVVLRSCHASQRSGADGGRCLCAGAGRGCAPSGSPRHTLLPRSLRHI